MKPYLAVTPAGCYYAVENDELTPERLFLFGLMRTAQTPAIQAITQGNRASAARVTAMIEAGFLVLRDEPEQLPSGTLTELLPHVLPELAQGGRVVLTESRQGLFLDFTGFSRDQAEELAVLASGLRALADQKSSLLGADLGIASRAFGIIDPAGNSEIGFWPLYVGHNVFTLTLLGIPLFNNQAFRQLVWVLVERYGETRAEHTL